MTKSNKILCIVGAILIAFVGLFGIVFATQEDRVVKADYVESTYYSNYYYVPVTFVTSSGGNTFTSWGGQEVSMLYVRSIFSNSTFTLQGSLLSQNSGAVLHDYNFIERSLDFSGTSSGYFYVNTNVYLRYYIVKDVNFDSMSISNLQTYSEVAGFRPEHPYRAENRLRFSDSNNNFFEIQFIMYMTSSNVNLVSIAGDGMLLADNFFLANTGSISDNQYYQAGFNAGLADNQTDIYNEGYQNAIDTNKQSWINYGKQQGIAQASDYTFLGLIGATIDAPISALFGRLDTDSESPTYNQYVGGFFNFELLGVNLRSFFFAILTFALVIVIIRFALAR